MLAAEAECSLSRKAALGREWRAPAIDDRSAKGRARALKTLVYPNGQGTAGRWSGLLDRHRRAWRVSKSFPSGTANGSRIHAAVS